MAQVKWTKNAIEDIYNVMEYLRHYSDRYAEAFADKIFERTEILERFPRSGRIVPEFENENIRELIHTSYRIVYVILAEDRLDILAVHPSALPFGEGFLGGE
jgi:plasmid stabilization system protein ParE